MYRLVSNSQLLIGLLILVCALCLHFLPAKPQRVVPEKHGRPKSRGEPKLPERVDWRHESLMVHAKSRLISIPDVHGDLEGLLLVLRAAKLITSESQTDWIGGDSVLVQTGDVLDRGDGEVEILRLLAKLRLQAEAVGGKVMQLMGNHELLNIMGVFNYATRGGNKAFKSIGGRTTAFSPSSGGEFAQFTRMLPVACAVEWLGSPGSRIVFAHAGIRPQFLKSGDAAHILEELNDQVMARTNAEAHMVRARYNDPVFSDNGPLWNRFFSLDKNEGRVCAELQETLDLLGASQMVVGHTPQTGQVGARCGGRLILSDVGFAQYYYGHYLALEFFQDGSFSFIEPLGKPDAKLY